MQKIKKVVIPVAGKGTRFLPITKTISKTLLPIIDRPVIHYLLEEAIEAGIEEALIIIGSDQNDVVNYFNMESNYVNHLNKEYPEIENIRNLKSKIRISYVFQEKARGLGDAIRLAKAFAGKDRRTLPEMRKGPDCPAHEKRPPLLWLRRKRKRLRFHVLAKAFRAKMSGMRQLHGGKRK